jgi:hypothetical protein
MAEIGSLPRFLSVPRGTLRHALEHLPQIPFFEREGFRESVSRLKSLAPPPPPWRDHPGYRTQRFGKAF